MGSHFPGAKGAPRWGISTAASRRTYCLGQWDRPARGETIVRRQLGARDLQLAPRPSGRVIKGNVERSHLLHLSTLTADLAFLLSSPKDRTLTSRRARYPARK